MARGDAGGRDPTAPPGTERPRRFRPRLRYELVGCGLHGHELLGTDAASLRPEDALYARESGGLHWYRCLRCDSWVALSPPSKPAVPYPPRREDVVLPLRGRPLRDRYVLRLIALDRLLHFLVLSAIAVAIVLFAAHRDALNADFSRVLKNIQGGLGGPVRSNRGIVHDLQQLFTVSTTSLYLVAAGVAAYAALEATEAVGLWQGRRWAEYLTFVATVIFVPYEVWELTKTVSVLKVVTLIINLAIVVYLLVAKRLFGLRGGRRGRTRRARGRHRLGRHRMGHSGPPLRRRDRPHPDRGFVASYGAALIRDRIRLPAVRYRPHRSDRTQLRGISRCRNSLLRDVSAPALRGNQPVEDLPHLAANLAHRVTNLLALQISAAIGRSWRR